MAFQPAPGVWRLVFEQSQSGSRFTNIIHVRAGQAPVTPWSAELLVVIHRAFHNLWQPFMLQSWRAAGVTAYDLSAADAPKYELVYPEGFVGGRTSGAPMPLNCAFAITLRTEVRGRNGQGRWFQGGLAEADGTHRELSAERAADFVTCVEGLADVLRGVGWVLGVLSRQSGGVLRPAGILNDVTAITYSDLRLDSQRKRLG